MGSVAGLLDSYQLSLVIKAVIMYQLSVFKTLILAGIELDRFLGTSVELFGELPLGYFEVTLPNSSMVSLHGLF